jgi:hypothetical protein
LASTTSLEGAYLLLVDLSARHSSHGVGNFDERPWGVSMSVTNVDDVLGGGPRGK